MTLINDCVHGIIHVPEWAEPILKTKLFMRLQRVKQVGTLEKAWPSATHTRYEHSIGCFHLALEYASILKLNDLDTQAFALASLLHDIAHGPFSHMFEKCEFEYDHDEYRMYILDNDEQMATHIDTTMRDEIKKIWLGKNKILYTLLGGVAGVDRMDYLLRDSYHLKPRQQLDKTCIQTIMQETKIKNNQIVYTNRGCVSIGHFLENRCYMYREVYGHKKCLLFEAQLLEGIKLIPKEDITQCFATLDKFEMFDDAYILSFAWLGNDYILNYIRGVLDPKIKNIEFKKRGLTGEEYQEIICDTTMEPFKQSYILFKNHFKGIYDI